MRRVYDGVSEFSTNDQQVARAVAGKALSSRHRWTSRGAVCEPGACLTPGPAALMVRVRACACFRPGDPRFLGHALMDSRTRTGVLATVFIDRTRRVAGDLGLDHRVLLGRAIAGDFGRACCWRTPTHRERRPDAGGLVARRDAGHAWFRRPRSSTRPMQQTIRKRLARARTGRPRGAS